MNDKELLELFKMILACGIKQRKPKCPTPR